MVVQPLPILAGISCPRCGRFSIVRCPDLALVGSNAADGKRWASWICWTHRTKAMCWFSGYYVLDMYDDWSDNVQLITEDGSAVPLRTDEMKRMLQRWA